MLKVEFVDLDGDGKRELVISGLVCFTDEEGHKVLRREAVVYIYALLSGPWASSRGWTGHES